MEQPPPYNTSEKQHPGEISPSPPQPGYPPQQPGYPPQQHGYPPQQPGYPPQQHGYPPQGYPPPQQGYPPQQVGMQQQSNNTTTVVVQNQPQPQAVTAIIPIVNDHMGLSIFACLCCCWPIGIFAIMKSSEARNRFVAGDYAGAMSSAQTARNLAWIAIICGMIIIPLIIILRVVVFTASQSNSHN